MLVSAIVAVGNNRVIGKDNDLPWYLPADLRYFKKTTLGRHIIMGRKCYESIGQPLPKRTNIVLTRNAFFTGTGLIVAHSIEEALQLAADNGETEAMILGGGEIYRQSVPLWDRLYLTQVDVDVPDGDTFFPELDPAQWTLVREEAHDPDEKNPHAYAFRVYERRESF